VIIHKLQARESRTVDSRSKLHRPTSLLSLWLLTGDWSRPRPGPGPPARDLWIVLATS